MTIFFAMPLHVFVVMTRSTIFLVRNAGSSSKKKPHFEHETKDAVPVLRLADEIELLGH